MIKCIHKFQTAGTSADDPVPVTSITDAQRPFFVFCGRAWYPQKVPVKFLEYRIFCVVS